MTGDFTRKKWKDKVKLKRVDGDDELWETEVCPANGLGLLLPGL